MYTVHVSGQAEFVSSLFRAIEKVTELLTVQSIEFVVNGASISNLLDEAYEHHLMRCVGDSLWRPTTVTSLREQQVL